MRGMILKTFMDAFVGTLNIEYNPMYLDQIYAGAVMPGYVLWAILSE